eukprot:CAMPEP_0201559680 /NCGR_PEP_ID=MMETSP0173_2-20130828/75707_1 /ASSEMBLY_ACC=CAM_ASM_000268 /TAXON_ID=218659 /ORGANISM="Vexillifera sp., Strain DIVA3 564/2" /LENGTH=108 /DNA_ID=CAMNT_0047973885 /DNA_START=685 /DNA_END=1011 /DNA_ORIENTATION=+
MSIGFTTATHSMDAQPGWSEYSWAFHGDENCMYLCGHRKPCTKGRPWRNGDRVGCGYRNGAFYWVINGQIIGRHFDPRFSSSSSEGRIYPTLSISSPDQQFHVIFDQA